MSLINRHLTFGTGPDSAPVHHHTFFPQSEYCWNCAKLIILAWCREVAGKCLKISVGDAMHCEFHWCLSNNFILNILGKDVVMRNSYHGYNSNILKHLIKGIMWKYKKSLIYVAFSYAALAHAVLYAVLHSSTKYLYLFQKKGGKCRKNKYWYWNHFWVFNAVPEMSFRTSVWHSISQPQMNCFLNYFY